MGSRPKLGRCPESTFAQAPQSQDIAAAMERTAAPLPVESGQVTLTLTVNGSVQMRR